MCCRMEISAEIEDGRRLFTLSTASNGLYGITLLGADLI